MIVTSDPTPDDKKDDREIVVWARDEAAPIVVPMPALNGAVKVDQLTPVNTEALSGLYLTADDKPAEIAIVDPSTQTISFSATTDDIAKAAELKSVDQLTLLGLVSGHLFILVNEKTDGRVLSIDLDKSTLREVDTGGGITGAELTPDGALLLALTCPDNCTAQSLTAYDLSSEAPLWVESVPAQMTFDDAAIEATKLDGKPAYSALVQNKGIGIIFQIPKDPSAEVVRLAADTNARLGTIAYDGEHGYKTVESASDVTSSEGVDAAGLLAKYRIPLERQKLRLYVAPNSIAVYQGKDATRIAGVTYDGDLLVYRMQPDGQFVEDVSFRPIKIAGSNCISAAAFGGDGRSLLFRHIDESLFYVAAVGNGANVGWHKGSSGRAGESRIDLSESNSGDDLRRAEEGRRRHHREDRRSRQDARRLRASRQEGRGLVGQRRRHGRGQHARRPARVGRERQRGDGRYARIPAARTRRRRAHLDCRRPAATARRHGLALGGRYRAEPAGKRGRYPIRRCRGERCGQAAEAPRRKRAGGGRVQPRRRYRRRLQ